MGLIPYQPKHLPQILSLFYETVHTINAADYTPAQLDAWAPAASDQARWAASLSANFALIAEENGIITGFADMDSTGYLDRLYVHKDYQRQGIASQLAQALEQHARCLCAPTVVTHASITARPFFEKRGYRVIREQQVCRFGQHLTNFVMELPLK